MRVYILLTLVMSMCYWIIFLLSMLFDIDGFKRFIKNIKAERFGIEIFILATTVLSVPFSLCGLVYEIKRLIKKG